MGADHSLELNLRIGKQQVCLTTRVPEGHLSLGYFVPIAASLTDLTVAEASREAAAAGV
jgi:hypothetical protein